MSDPTLPAELHAKVQALRDNVARVFVGEPRVIDLVLTGLFAGGHLLIEDVPGVGKTTLARALAKSLDVAFHRIQFTPDLMPSDLLGVSIWDPERREFVFKAGPLFANVVLADEINRTPPRTQSALLEAMNEARVTVDGTTRPLPAPFFVVATMNPVESRGAFELPESQLDRFLLRIDVGYPDREGMRRVLREQGHGDRVADLAPVLGADEVSAVQRAVAGIRVEEAIEDYVMAIGDATRTHPEIVLGASPRALLGLVVAARARALLAGRSFVVPDDVKELALPVLAHRLAVRGASRDRATQILRDLLGRLPARA